MSKKPRPRDVKRNGETRSTKLLKPKTFLLKRSKKDLKRKMRRKNKMRLKLSLRKQIKLRRKKRRQPRESLSSRSN
jgi:hypothetical protein